MRKRMVLYSMVTMSLVLCTFLVMAVPASAYPPNITDSAGREVTIQMPITRIIVLNNDAAEAVKVLGKVDNIVGVAEVIKTKKSYYFPELEKTQSVGKWSDPDFEKIIDIAANNTGTIVPDILVIQYVYPGKTYGVGHVEEGLKDHPNITVVGFDFYKQETICEEVEKLGKILNCEENASKYIIWRRDKEEAVATGIAGIEPISRDDLSEEILSYLRATYLGEPVEHLELDKLRRQAWYHIYGPKPWVFIETRHKGLGDISTRGPGSGDHITCTMAGGYNIASDLDKAYPHVDWEWVLRQKPDVIIKGKYTTGWGWSSTDEPEGLVDEIKSRPGAGDIFAVRDGRVYAFCNEPLYGLDSVVGLTYWAKLIHPELNLDPDEVYREYLTKFMGNISYEDAIFVYPGV